MTREISIVVILAIVLAGGSFVYHSGYFNRPSLEMRNYPALHLVYKEHKGSWNDLPEVRADVKNWLKARGIKCVDTFDELISNWRETNDQAELESNSGCIVESEQKNLGPGEYKYKYIPAKEVLVASFRGSPRLAKGKIRVAQLAYRYRMHKRIVGTVIRIVREGNPFWEQPMQVNLFTLGESLPENQPAAQSGMKPSPQHAPPATQAPPAPQPPTQPAAQPAAPQSQPPTPAPPAQPAQAAPAVRPSPPAQPMPPAQPANPAPPPSKAK